jgi:hypothetical protein
MLDTVARSETELPLDAICKRERVEQELRSNSARSNREIGRVCGVDGKTVGAARERLRISLSDGDAGNRPSPTEFRSMLITAGDEFDKKFPHETAEEVVDRMMAEGKISYATAGQGGVSDEVARTTGPVRNVMGRTQCPPPPGVVDEPEENHFYPESESLVVPGQPAIAVYTNRFNQIVIRQEAQMYGEDIFVYICPQHLETLVARLRRVAEEIGG